MLYSYNQRIEGNEAALNTSLSYYTRRFVNIFFNSRVPSERLPKVFAWNSLSIYATALYGPSVDRRGSFQRPVETSLCFRGANP